MPNIAAAQAGNWSATSTWVGGVLPTAADDVYANGFSVSLNQNINVLSLRTTAVTGINAGGGFTTSVANISINADIHTGTTTALIVGVVGTVTGSGNIFGSTTTGIVAVNCTATNVTCNWTGNVTGGSLSNANGFIWSSNGTLTFTGTTSAGTGISSHGIAVTGPGTANIFGNSVGNSGSGASGIINHSNGTVTLNGNAMGGTIASSQGGSNIGVGIFNIIGNSIASAVASGATNGATCTMRVSRAVASTGVAASVPGVIGSSALGLTVVREIEFGSNGQVPVSGFIRFDNANTILVQVRQENNTANTLADTTNAAGLLPGVANVRLGTVYNSGSSIGTLTVPVPANVRIGISTDNTVGTAALTPADITSAMNVAFPRLVNVSTPEINGAQLVSLIAP